MVIQNTVLQAGDTGGPYNRDLFLSIPVLVKTIPQRLQGPLRGISSYL